MLHSTAAAEHNHTHTYTHTHTHNAVELDKFELVTSNLYNDSSSDIVPTVTAKNRLTPMSYTVGNNAQLASKGLTKKQKKTPVC